MAQSNDKRIAALENEEAKRLEEARLARGNENWQPAQGAGVLPEDQWRKYSPNSKDIQNPEIEEDEEVKGGSNDTGQS